MCLPGDKPVLSGASNAVGEETDDDEDDDAYDWTADK